LEHEFMSIKHIFEQMKSAINAKPAVE